MTHNFVLYLLLFLKTDICPFSQLIRPSFNTLEYFNTHSLEVKIGKQINSRASNFRNVVC